MSRSLFTAFQCLPQLPVKLGPIYAPPHPLSLHSLRSSPLSSSFSFSRLHGQRSLSHNNYSSNSKQAPILCSVFPDDKGISNSSSQNTDDSPLSSPSSSSPPSSGTWFTRLLTNEDLRDSLIAIFLAILLRAFVIEPRYIPSLSMFPTLDVGDQLLVEKVSNKIAGGPYRGDVVVFQPGKALIDAGYKKEDAFIKRVIATEGDYVKVQKGRLYVNDRLVNEQDVVNEPMEYEFGPVQVPKGCLLVLGDNRNNSFDSHIWGFLPRENVIGRAVLRYWPLDRWAVLIDRHDYSASSKQKQLEQSPSLTASSQPQASIFATEDHAR